MLDLSRTEDGSKGLVSIVIPVYNVERYLRKCLNSVISQTYSEIEIILVDDGTPDGSGKICEEYAEIDKRVKVYHKENGGLSDARNYGIKKATGEFITFIDSDDYVDYDYVDYLIKLAKKHNCLLSICQHRTLYDNGSIKDHGYSNEEIMNSHECLERMLYHDVIDTSAWAKLYHKSLFDNICYPKGRIFEDIGTTYKFLLKSETIAVGYETKYNYIFHNNSIVNGEFNSRKFDMLDMTDQMAKDVIKIFPDLLSAVQRRRVYARLSTLNQMLNTTEYEDEKKQIIKFIKEHTKEILTDKNAPNRDKIAIRLLRISYKAYRATWLTYQRKIMGR